MTEPSTGRNSSQFTVHRSPRHGQAPSERELGSEEFTVHSQDADLAPRVRPRADTLRNALAPVKDALRGWIVPPRVLVDPPPAWDELSAYAYRGSWTKDARGFLRGLGTLWLVAVTLPVAAACRYVEWIFTRPSRALVVTGLWLLFVHTTAAGAWFVTNIVNPFWSALGWIFT